MSSSSLPLRRFHKVKEAMAQVCSDDERCDHLVWWNGGVGESFLWLLKYNTLLVEYFWAKSTYFKLSLFLAHVFLLATSFYNWRITSWYQMPGFFWWRLSQLLYLAFGDLGGGNSNIFFSPRKLGKISNLTNILQMGWNHQLGDSIVF